MRSLLKVLVIVALVAPLRADASEICGNGSDDDGDTYADEGCYPALATGQCESPLCEDTGIVSPLKGALHYALPPDIAPRVPYGPGIGLRRFYLSQDEVAIDPALQAGGTHVSSTGAVTPSWPTHQSGDVALLIVESAGGQAATLSDAQGFAAVTGAVVGDDVDVNGTRLTVFWKRASSSSELSPTVADSGDHTLAQILTFRGVVKTGNPWDVVGTSATSGTAEHPFTMPTVTTTAANTLLVNIVSGSGQGWGVSDIDWYLTSRPDIELTSTLEGNDGGFGVATQAQASAGTSSAATGYFWNGFDTAHYERQARLVVALKTDPTPSKPLGDRWSHTYMSWLHKQTTPAYDQVVVRSNRGQNVLFSWNGYTAQGWDRYAPKAGFKDKYQWIAQRPSAPFEYHLRTMTGETLVYNRAGRLIEIWDSLATPNKVLVAYDGNGQVSTVTDASGTRRLLFSYTGDSLTSIAFQINASGTWTTYHTTAYGYTGTNNTTVTIGGTLAQSNIYDVNNRLTQINDGGGKTIMKLAYDQSVAGRVVRVETGRGVLGWEYASSRASCSGKTLMFFNRGNTNTCTVDSDCGSGFLCGGSTGATGSGQCFRAARCLTVSSPSEDVITSVTAVGPPGESCDGACLDALSYVWNTTGGVLDLKATEDPSGKFLTKTFDANGLPTKIVYGDADSDPTNAHSGREVFLFYGNTSFPGKVTEVRRKSDLSADRSSCSSTSTLGCARTSYTYNTDGMLESVEQKGFTSDGAVASFTYTTTFAYNPTRKDLVDTIDGPLTGTDDVTVFEYWSSTDPLKNWFVQNVKRRKDATNFLVQSTLTYDFWGNPTSVEDFDDTLTCMTYASDLGHLTEHRETMAGQTSCTANTADLVMSWERDSHQRVTKLTRPDGSCRHYAYDSMGRLEFIRRRDDCTAASSGETMQFFYSADGVVTKVETLDSSNAVKRRQELTYFDSRRLEKLINPVNTAKHTAISYDSRGLVTDLTAIDGSSNLSRTSWTYDAEGRVSTEKRYKDATTFDTWSLLFDWLGNQKEVWDDDRKTTLSESDDLGRMTKLDSPDLGGYPTVKVYDAASRLTTTMELYGSTNQQTHSFTFDSVGRPLNADYSGSCPTGTSHAEIQRVYDAPASCPTGMTCSNTAGRLAYVKVTLLCSSTYSSTDGALDQETWFAYDAAGRVTREYITDDAGRVADHQYEWTKNGTLKQVTTPSGTVLGSTYGSAGHNSDTDRITALWRTSTSTPIIDNALWFPFGPVQQYNQMNTQSTYPLRTRIDRNLAYRITAIEVEKQATGDDDYSVAITEDAKGRVTARDYWPNSTGITDSFFLYDLQDRVLCETTSFASSCPTSGSTLKNNHNLSPPFTPGGDWKQILRPIPGSTGLTNAFSLNGTNTHQIQSVNQSDGTPTLGPTSIGHDNRGNRSYDDNQVTLTNDRRDYGYDARRNVTSVQGKYYTGSVWHSYTITSAFDAQNRRVFKSFLDVDTGESAEWFFYYDANDRLVEVRHTPDTSDGSTYSLFQMFWFGDRLVLYWQTDYPSAATSKRYVSTDETGRPISMMCWSTGNCPEVWAINASAWGMDSNVVGPGVFQPVLFAGQYRDPESVAVQNDGMTMHRPELALNGVRTYDPFTGSYLQVDPLLDFTWSTYVYANSDPVGKVDPTGAAFNDRSYYESAEGSPIRQNAGGGGAAIRTKGPGLGCTLAFHIGIGVGALAGGIFGEMLAGPLGAAVYGAEGAGLGALWAAAMCGKFSKTITVVTPPT